MQLVVLNLKAHCQSEIKLDKVFHQPSLEISPPTHYEEIHRTIHVCYLNTSCDSLNKSCDAVGCKNFCANQFGAKLFSMSMGILDLLHKKKKKISYKICCNAFLNKINITAYFKNLTVNLHIFYPLNTHQILYQSNIIYYMINNLIFYT